MLIYIPEQVDKIPNNTKINPFSFSFFYFHVIDSDWTIGEKSRRFLFKASVRVDIFVVFENPLKARRSKNKRRKILRLSSYLNLFDGNRRDFSTVRSLVPEYHFSILFPPQRHMHFKLVPPQ